MRGVNRWTGIGNLGADPETRFTQGGSPVTNFRLACNEQWKDRNGEAQSRTEWVSCVAFGKLAEIAGEYLRKGAPVYVEGKLSTSSWDDKDTGKKLYKTEVILSEMRFLGNREGGSQQGTHQRPDPYQAQADYAARQQASSGQAEAPLDDFDDEIPFAPFGAGTWG